MHLQMSEFALLSVMPNANINMIEREGKCTIGKESILKIEVSLGTETRGAPTKASPAPVLSTVFTEKLEILPLKLCTSNMYIISI